ncbi:sulfite exporter TauE/SafE family protein [Synechococcus sp. CB0101]|uniref:sulfite exporter TauE/SafE family protein n=1 Tax=Synechococcus sp. CB0101 TaxID=232348 RepID=UPI0002001729
MTSGVIAAALAVVAFLYACVGHAGASGYIAVLALAGWPAEQIKPLALLLNTLVASVGCWNFLRAGHLPWQRLWPVYVLAIPAAFLGGWLALPALWFRRLVGVVLLLSAWRLGRRLQDPPLLQEPRPAVLMAAGGVLGLLAGLTGTGGGVFLTPLLLLCRWCTTRQAAAVSVLFILVNSIAGLAGLAWAGAWPAGAFARPDLLLWLGVVVLAGGLGSRLGSRHWPVAWIRRALAAVLLLASWKLLGL